MVYTYIAIEDKNKLVGGKILAEMVEDSTGNKGFLIKRLTGEEVIISAKDIYISDNVKKRGKK